MKETRVRFAPSPTGALHVGGARTALYNFLFAKKHKGKIILRIEDTDQNRYIDGAEKHIKESLKWLGIHFDEGPDMGGVFAPYRQSERKNIYLQYAKQLLDSGHAYIAFDSEIELKVMRDSVKTQENTNPQYDAATRMCMQNSLTLSDGEVKKRLERKDSFVIRLKVPENETITMHDLIRGKVTTHTSQIDDKVLIKSDNMPTYHLAHVVDDYLMKISHVIRGEEWLTSTPFHTLIYKYLRWEESMPKFAHLPLLLKSDGNGKLSKRDAEHMGFPILPISWLDPRTNKKMKGFREEGYSSGALANFLALLGWNPGDDRELFTLTELIEVFDIEKIGKAGAKFLFQKAKWFNQHHLRLIPDGELVIALQVLLAQKKIYITSEKVKHIVMALKDRVAFISDFFEMGVFFFYAPTVFDATIKSKIWNEKMITFLKNYINELKKTTTHSESHIVNSLNEVVKSSDVSKGKAMQAIRMALTGGAFGPDLIVIMSILGKEEVVRRLEYALSN